MNRPVSASSKPMVFVPLVAFAPEASEGGEVGEMASAVPASLAAGAGMHIISHALHMIELVEPLVQAQSPPPTSPQATALQQMFNAQNVQAAPGSYPGVWLDWGMAVQLGLVTPDPVSSTEVNQTSSLADRVSARRNQLQELSPSSPAQQKTPQRGSSSASSGSSWSAPKMSLPWQKKFTPK